MRAESAHSLNICESSDRSRRRFLAWHSWHARCSDGWPSQRRTKRKPNLFGNRFHEPPLPASTRANRMLDSWTSRSNSGSCLRRGSDRSSRSGIALLRRLRQPGLDLDSASSASTAELERHRTGGRLSRAAGDAILGVGAVLAKVRECTRLSLRRPHRLRRRWRRARTGRRDAVFGRMRCAASRTLLSWSRSCWGESMFQLKRAYEPASRGDGCRVLPLAGGVLELASRQTGPADRPRIEGRIHGPGALASTKPAVTAAIERLLGLRIDMTEF